MIDINEYTAFLEGRDVLVVCGDKSIIFYPYIETNNLKTHFWHLANIKGAMFVDSPRLVCLNWELLGKD